MNDATQFFDTTAAGGYEIERSVRFNSADSAYLSRTPASAGNRKTWTWAGWVKISAVAATSKVLFGTADAGTNNNSCAIRFNTNLQLEVYDLTTVFRINLVTTQVFRDTGAWSHIVVAVDTTQATSTDRVKIYFNGSQITAFGTATYPSQNLDTLVNSTVAHGIGRGGSYDALYFNGYLADIHLIDGQALDPTSFGEFDADNVWQPKAFSGGSYGTNGFHLPFSDNSTASALGTDTSGNSNNWTVNNISVTAGSGNDSLVDSPTNGSQTDTGVGGEVSGNYCTLNPLDTNTLILVRNGNIDYTFPGGGDFGRTSGTMALFDNCYWEVTLGSGSFINTQAIGITQNSNSGSTAGPGSSSAEYAWYNSGAFVNNGSTIATYSSYSFNAVLSFAYSNGKLFMALNNTWQNSGNPVAGTGAVATGLTGNWKPFFSTDRSNLVHSVNFGQRPFAYTAPSGYKALCTTNLPTPTIADGSTAMDIALWTGQGNTNDRTITTSFNPDLVWIKSRSDGTYNHALFDANRGYGTNNVLSSNTAGAEGATDQGYIKSSTDSSITLGISGGGNAYYNGNNFTYAAWYWDAGTSTVTNNDGSISSQVRANASAGFSVVTYTGTGANATVGHGCGTAPSLIIVKCRSDGNTNWPVYHASLGASTRIYLDATVAASTGTNWNSTSPTSSVFSVGNNPDTNGSSRTYVAYCFAPVAGYSSMGSYVGNGSADGPFVFTGMRPRWVMIKESSASGNNWNIWDATRDNYNVTSKQLKASAADAEGTNTFADFTSNGFKIRASTGGINASSVTYIYAAFAEHPFQTSRAR